MADWSFLTNHARALLVLARDPATRLRDLATTLDVTERTAYGIVADLVEAGYVEKEKDGRRNRYTVRGDRPVRDPIAPDRTIGAVLGLPAESRPGRGRRGPSPARRSVGSSG